MLSDGTPAEQVFDKHHGLCVGLLFDELDLSWSIVDSRGIANHSPRKDSHRERDSCRSDWSIARTEELFEESVEVVASVAQFEEDLLHLFIAVGHVASEWHGSQDQETAAHLSLSDPGGNESASELSIQAFHS